MTNGPCRGLSVKPGVAGVRNAMSGRHTRESRHYVLTGKVKGAQKEAQAQLWFCQNFPRVQVLRFRFWRLREVGGGASTPKAKSAAVD